jgi:hypothetical protein
MRYIAFWLAVTLAFATGASAQVPDETPSRATAKVHNPEVGASTQGKAWCTPTAWPWREIRNGEVFDFEKRCPATNQGWDDPCREIAPQFLVAVLTVPECRDQLVQHRLRIRGVRILGNVDLSNAEVSPEVWIEGSRIEGKLFLDGSHWKRRLSLEGSTLTGDLQASRMHTEDDVTLANRAQINGIVDLQAAKIDGSLWMNDYSRFVGTVLANSISVAGSMRMEKAAFDSNVQLITSNVQSNLNMSSSTVAGEVTANSLHFAGALFMKEGGHFGGRVDLTGATIGNNLEMSTSFFAKAVTAAPITVKGSLLMGDGAIFSDQLNLTGTKVNSNLEMSKSRFLGKVIFDSLHVQGNLIMMQAEFLEEVNMSAAKVSGTLDLEQATATKIDLSGATARELWLDTTRWWCLSDPSHWTLGDPDKGQPQCGGKEPMLNLQNAQVTALKESTKAWPPSLRLEGFRCDSLLTERDDRADSVGPKGQDQRKVEFSGSTSGIPQHSIEEWKDWLARASFSSQPYTQLSSILAAAGRRDAADGVQFAGRVREWKDSCHDFWVQLFRAEFRRLLDCGRLTVLGGVVGYGIGLYSFFVLFWVFLFTVIGAIVLRRSPNTRKHGPFWLLGASLHRLLPIIQLSKEFSDFFDNPLPLEVDNPRNLNRWQTAYFAIHAVFGWILGFFVLAAMAGVTQKV